MELKRYRAKGAFFCLAVVLPLLVGGCASYPDAPKINQMAVQTPPTYVIGAGDTLQIYVFDNQGLSTSLPVRPDGEITMPLVPDLMVSGLTPAEAGAKIQTALSKYVKNPSVSVMVTGFKGPISRQIRIVGEAGKPQTMQYVAGLTVLDLIIQAGGLTQFADGNHAILLRTADGAETKYRVRLDDLMHGDMSANAAVLPGDVLIIPQSWF